MDRRFYSWISAALATGWLAGCAAQQPPADNFQAVQLDAKAFVPKVSSFLVLLDASSSMSDDYQGKDKFILARHTVSRINQTLPALSYQGGLVAFGSGRCLGGEDTSDLYGMSPYKRADLEAGLTSITCASGTTPMGKGIERATDKLDGSTGKVALLIVSDAWEVKGERALSAARKLKSTLGDKLCIYPIQIGKDEAGAMLMSELADVGECGFAKNADEIAAPAAMADYVTKVFLNAAPPPPPAPVAVAPVDGDDDGDGVKNSKDKCPNTPKGVPVNANGCWEFKGLTFDFDKAVIKNPASLDEAITIMKANPNLTGEIRGYTDGKGTEKYNQKLSERRANAVREYFIQHGIAADRIRAKGYGMANPVASNDTEEGRAQNRRVELEPDR
ncbi:MAG: OmpA family protein [Deltaproteobacteria bacterium]|nr:OmpA family protein [Deltaproteobacteria bacterium]